MLVTELYELTDLKWSRPLVYLHHNHNNAFPNQEGLGAGLVVQMYLFKKNIFIIGNLYSRTIKFYKFPSLLGNLCWKCRQRSKNCYSNCYEEKTIQRWINYTWYVRILFFKKDFGTFKKRLIRHFIICIFFFFCLNQQNIHIFARAFSLWLELQSEWSVVLCQMPPNGWTKRVRTARFKLHLLALFVGNWRAFNSSFLPPNISFSHFFTYVFTRIYCIFVNHFFHWIVIEILICLFFSLWSSDPTLFINPFLINFPK